MEIKTAENPDMKKMILDFCEQFGKGLKAAQGIFSKGLRFSPDYDNIIICGMGGSALPAELLSNLCRLNIIIHKSYDLPLRVKPGSLVICVSYSGNTEETISAFQAALKKKLSIIIITTGGRLADLAAKNKIPTVIIPPPYTPPRLALGIQFSALSQILINQRLLPVHFSEQIKNLGKIKCGAFEKKAEILAEKIGRKIPLIYTSEKLKGLGLVWKNNFNENSKTPAFANYLPELNHNEIVGFQKIKNKKAGNQFIVLALKDASDHPRIIKRVKITRDILKKEGIETEIIELKGKNQLEKIFFGAILGLWTSYLLALKRKVDPIQIKTINELKNKLKS